MDSFEISATFSATPAQLYAAWTDPEQHAEFTGGQATGATEVGAEFTAWDGYISGRYVNLIENQRIEQSWRTADFVPEQQNSVLVIEFAAVPAGCEVKIRHSQIPVGQGRRYQQGWVDFYFEPLSLWLAGQTP